MIVLRFSVSFEFPRKVTNLRLCAIKLRHFRIRFRPAIMKSIFSDWRIVVSGMSSFATAFFCGDFRTRKRLMLLLKEIF